MSTCQRAGGPIARCLRQRSIANGSPAMTRFFSGTSQPQEKAAAPATPTTTTTTTTTTKATTTMTKEPAANKGAPQPRNPNDTEWKTRKLDPNVTTLHWAERELIKRGTPPIGSRRRRVAIRTSKNVPFEQLPYQCFQEARKILQADREEKVKHIQAEVAKIRRLEAKDAGDIKGGEWVRQKRLKSLRDYVEELKILADINDPLVKRRFEDGLGDMNKPIYRYLARKRWESYQRLLIEQRISQFHITPDVLPKFTPTADVQLFFRAQKVSPGAFVDSLVSESPPRLRVQLFDPGERLVSVIVLDSDVPLPEADAYGRRLHYLAANVPLGPASGSLPLGRADARSQLAVPWLPAFSQKGAPYHRLSVWLLEQRDNRPLDVARLRDLYAASRDGFCLMSFCDLFGAVPVGFNMFRSVWDDNTAAVMARHGIPGADVELRRQRIVSLKPPRKERGWEAKRQKPKYRSLWKYSKRIA